MTSRAASCDGKLRYDSHSQAARRIGKSAAGNLHAYRCPVCGGYHIGGQLLRIAKRKREDRT